MATWLCHGSRNRMALQGGSKPSIHQLPTKNCRALVVLLVPLLAILRHIHISDPSENMYRSCRFADLCSPFRDLWSPGKPRYPRSRQLDSGNVKQDFYRCLECFLMFFGRYLGYDFRIQPLDFYSWTATLSVVGVIFSPIAADLQDFILRVRDPQILHPPMHLDRFWTFLKKVMLNCCKEVESIHEHHTAPFGMMNNLNYQWFFQGLWTIQPVQNLFRVPCVNLLQVFVLKAQWKKTLPKPCWYAMSQSQAGRTGTESWHISQSHEECWKFLWFSRWWFQTFVFHLVLGWVWDIYLFRLDHCS